MKYRVRSYDFPCITCYCGGKKIKIFEDVNMNLSLVLQMELLSEPGCSAASDMEM